MNGAAARDRSPVVLLLAWGVHLLTASGAVLAVLALAEIARGGFGRAALYLIAAMAIDAVDGTLARRSAVAERIPAIDGRRLDDIVDYLNFAVVPVVFLLVWGAFAHGSVAALPVLASAYGFAQKDAKTADDFFLGWPSYWNVLALYLWLFEVGPVAATGCVLVFCALIFVPLKYAYPSKLPRLRVATNLAGALWMGVLTLAVLAQGGLRWQLAAVSLAFPAWYLVVSAWLGGWPRLARRA